MESFIVNNVQFKVNFILQRVYCERYNGKKMFVHIFGDYNAHLKLESLFQYPGLATNVKLPKLNSNETVKLVTFDPIERHIKFVECRLDTKLYFAHHRYGKYYVYGQVPVVVKDRCDHIDIFTGAPIFDADDNLVSFMTDSFINNDNVQLIPVSGKSYRLQGMFCIDGVIRLYDENEIVRPIVSDHIDINVQYTKKYVEIQLIYKGNILSQLKIQCKFAGNVLIM
ncbi:p26-b [Hemileuca sp. nucleopolyhedrovirus]|uniref:p26-b n=1 Tax=Hemileuca sp. nucleopolyhedrovirus TaxID=1367203 RepID=S5N991_9ABAC|nr:p26-b [Hemileuca sp. nucleopolyhedrovirus]AGR56812.1 p26-b [Hemileuca sp. nucleopolyhedrovirus]